MHHVPRRHCPGSPSGARMTDSAPFPVILGMCQVVLKMTSAKTRRFHFSPESGLWSPWLVRISVLARGSSRTLQDGTWMWAHFAQFWSPSRRNVSTRPSIRGWHEIDAEPDSIRGRAPSSNWARDVSEKVRDASVGGRASRLQARRTPRHPGQVQPKEDSDDRHTIGNRPPPPFRCSARTRLPGVHR